MTPSDLAEQHRDLVHGLAWEHKRTRGGDVDDLIGEGMVALMGAARAFDPERGVPFTRFARRRVQGAMIDAFDYDRRHHPVDRRTEVFEMADPAAGPEQVAVDRFALARLLEAVADLPEGLRSTARVLVAGGSFRALAHAEGVTQSAIAHRLQEVRRRLRSAA